jgi:hypothetical protein
MLPLPYDPLYKSMDSGEVQPLSAWDQSHVLIWNNDGTLTARPKYSLGLPFERLRPVEEMGVVPAPVNVSWPASVNPFNWDAAKIYSQYFKAEEEEEVFWYGREYDKCDPPLNCGTKHWVDIGVVGPMREVVDDLGRTIKVGTVYENQVIVGLKAKDTSGFKTSWHQGDTGHSANVRIRQMAHVGQRKTINHVLKFVPGPTGWAKERFVIDRPGWYEVKVWSKDGGSVCCDPSASTTQKILFLDTPKEDEEINIADYDDGETETSLEGTTVTETSDDSNLGLVIAGIAIVGVGIWAAMSS